MTARITKIKQAEGKTTIQVEGSLHIEDAEVLEKTYAALRENGGSQNIEIDLAQISFLDSESASALCRMRRLGAELVGLHFFIQRVIEVAETCGE